MNDNKDVWTHILNYINYDDTKDEHIITSSQIKNAKSTWNGKKCQFEPRLLCKQDSKKSRPLIFKIHKLCILSIKNGVYILTKNNIYVSLKKYNGPPEKISHIYNSCILSLNNESNESSLLDSLRYDKILEKEKILGEPILYGPLFGGRRRCYFTTTLGNKEISINGSQYEIDGCFETENYICIAEVKSIAIDSFNIRQLYYPFKELYNKIGNKKKIICLFIYKDKRQIIHIYKYCWGDPNVMMDIKFMSYSKFIYCQL